MAQKMSTLEKKITIEDLFSGNVEEQKASPEFGILPYGWKTYREYDTSDGKTAIRYKVEPNDRVQKYRHYRYHRVKSSERYKVWKKGSRMQLAILNKNHSPRPRIVHIVFVDNRVVHADYGVVGDEKKKKGRAYVYKDISSNPKDLYSAKEAIKLALSERGKNYSLLWDAVGNLEVK